MVLAHQFLDQLPDNLRASVLGNTGSTIAFRIGGEDAAALEREYDQKQASHFIECPRYIAYARLLRDGEPYEYRLETGAPLKIAGGFRDNIVKQSAQRFGYAREKVERETKHLFG